MKSNSLKWVVLAILLVSVLLVPLYSFATTTTSNEIAFSVPANSFCDQSHTLDLSLVVSNTGSSAANVTLNLYKQDGTALTMSGTSYNGINSTLVPGTPINIAANNTTTYHLSYGGQLSNCVDRVYTGKISSTIDTILASGWITAANGNTPIIINAGKILNNASVPGPTQTPTPTPTQTPPPTYSGNLIPAMTSNTSPSGVASTSSFYSPYDAFKAFDHDTTNPGSLWYGNGLPAWIAYDFGAPTVVNKYVITAYTNGANAPNCLKSWTFEGWNGSSWTILDSRTNEPGWTDGEKRDYTFTNTTGFTKYRINATANQGGIEGIVLREIEMMQLQ